MTSTQIQKFLPHGALAQRVSQVRSLPGISSLTAAIEDQSQSTFGDILWAVRTWIINLGAVSIAAHLRHLGVKTAEAYYPIMGLPSITTPYDLVGLSCSEVSVAWCMQRIRALREQLGVGPLIVVGGPGMDGWWDALLAAGADAVILGDGQYPLTDLLGVLVPLQDGGRLTLRQAFQAARDTHQLDAVKDLTFSNSQGEKQALLTYAWVGKWS